MFKKLLFTLTTLGFVAQGFASDMMTPQQAIYYWAGKGNETNLQKISDMGYQLDLADENGDSSLCNAIQSKNYTAYAMLRKLGASITHDCIQNISEEEIVSFNEGYASWAQNHNSRISENKTVVPKSVPSSTKSPWIANSNAPNLLSGVRVESSSGLSTAQKVGIGVGVAALIGGGIALAAGGGGGGGGSDSSPSINDDHSTYTLDSCPTRAAKCLSSTAFGITKYKVLACQKGFSGLDCSSCATGYHEGTDGGCYPKINNCIHQPKDLCLSCNNGYIPSVDGKSCKVKIDNCAIQKDNQCDACETNYIKQNNRCYREIQNCDGQNADTCPKCKAGWTLENNTCTITSCPVLNTSTDGCSNYDRCQSGASNYYYNCTECLSTHQLGSNGKCYKKIDNCLTQHDSTCSGCASGYTLYNNQCYLEIPNCETGKQTGNTCSQCKAGWEVDGGRCKTVVCPTTNSSLTGCATYNTCQSGENSFYTCTSCNTGYKLGTDGKCYAEIPNCETQINDQCNSCEDGWNLQANACTPVTCPSTNTDNTGCDAPTTCNSAGTIYYTCTACTAGFVLGTNNNCIPDPACTGNPTAVANCETGDSCLRGTDTLHQCNKCRGDYVLSADKLSCTEPACVSMAIVNCTGAPIFDATSGQCICGLCAIGYMGFKCETCAPNYTEGDDHKCYPTVPNCAHQPNDKCDTCDTGYTEGADGKCYAEIPNCETQTNDKCDTCDAGYEGDNCTPIACTSTNTDNTGCDAPTTCNSAGTIYYTCTACNEGFEPGTNNNCIPDPACTGSPTTIANCKTPTTCLHGTDTLYTCTTCEPGYALDSTTNTCIPDPACTGNPTAVANCETGDSCLRGTDTLHQCNKCEGDYVLSADKLSCTAPTCASMAIPNCTGAPTFDATSGQCICGVCAPGYTGPKCSACAENYQKLNGKCVQYSSSIAATDLTDGALNTTKEIDKRIDTTTTSGKSNFILYALGNGINALADNINKKTQGGIYFDTEVTGSVSTTELSLRGLGGFGDVTSYNAKANGEGTEANAGVYMTNKAEGNMKGEIVGITGVNAYATNGGNAVGMLEIDNTVGIKMTGNVVGINGTYNAQSVGDGSGATATISIKDSSTANVYGMRSESDVYNAHGEDSTAVGNIKIIEASTAPVSTKEFYGLYSNNNSYNSNNDVSQGKIELSGKNADTKLTGIYGKNGAHSRLNDLISLTSSADGEYVAIQSDITASNNGDIIIQQTGAANLGTATGIHAKEAVNGAGGKITIKDVNDVVGIHSAQDGTLPLKNSINKGVIDISTTYDGKIAAGIHTINGTAENSGTIKIDNYLTAFGSNFKTDQKTGTYAFTNSGSGIISNPTNGSGISLTNIKENGYGILAEIDPTVTDSTAMLNVTNSGDISLQTQTTDAGLVGIHNDQGITTNSGKINLSNTSETAERTTFFGIYNNGSKALSSVVNSGAINLSSKLTNAATGIYSLDDSDITNTGTITITNEKRITATGIHVEDSSSNKTVLNEGTINLESTYDQGTVNTGEISYGIHAGRGYKVINSGTIRLTAPSNQNLYGIITNGDSYIENSRNITVSSGGNAYGIMAGSNFRNVIKNTGTIDVSSSNKLAEAYGIYLDSPTSSIINEGNIFVSVGEEGAYGANAYGIYINGSETYIKNTGTIKVNGVEAGTNVDGSKEEGNFIKLGPNGSLSNVNNAGELIAPTIDASALKLTLSSGSKTTGTTSIYGEAGIASDTVTKGFDKVYTEKGMISSPDTSKLTLKSESALFDASLADNGTDVIMKMKEFSDVMDNSSLAGFLSQNYALENNENFYNKLKSFGSESALNNSLKELTGKDVLSRFNFEDLTMMRELNYDINNNLFHNKDAHMSISGSVSPMAFKGDVGSTSRYGLVNKRDGATSVGLGIAFTDISSDDDNDSNSRQDTMYQMIVPFGYKVGKMDMVTSPRLGYAKGSYDRTGLGGLSYEGEIEKRVYGIMNEARYPLHLAGWSLEPTFEFNVLGYQQKGREDAKEFSLTIPNQNMLSVESGIGFYATKQTELTDGKLNLNAGLMLYHEFADPYTLRLGMNGMAGTFDVEDENRSENRAVARAGFNWSNKDNLELYGSVLSYIDSEARTKAQTGLNWKF